LRPDSLAWNSGAVLSSDEIGTFLDKGYVALRGALPADVARACEDAVWAALRQRGCARDDRSTWNVPVVRIPTPRGGPFATAATASAVQEACDQLIGEGRWWRRADIGGTIPVRFPSEADPGDAGWHIESSYEEAGRSRVSLASRARGLLALYLFTDGDVESAPTKVRPGSHLDVPPILAPAGEAGMEWPVAARMAATASARRPTVLATGRAGDVYLCDPFLVHAASWPHRGRRPRMIAQPAVALHSQLPLDPAVVLAPVEQAILAGLQASRQEPNRDRRKGVGPAMPLAELDLNLGQELP